MCGIAGKLVFDRMGRVDRAEIERMLEPISHRGPDGGGTHVDHNVGLGHRRLAIIDLNTGDQPMANEDGTVWVVFNGEIYNYKELRQQLIGLGHHFRTQSDTEVIIHAYEEFGPNSVMYLRGMFAFAIWDSRRKRLFVARDRVGIKPLYYRYTGKEFCFASELKSLIWDRSVPREVNYAAVRRFLSFSYVPGQETLLKGVLKLLPGHWLLLEAGRLTIQSYWDLQFTRQRYSMEFEEAVEELNRLLASTVRDHMIADVPVGVLLSGGVDSSGVLSFAVRETAKRVKTFTVGFDGGKVVDERPYARMVANRYGTDAYETSISAKDFWDFLPTYIWHMEEPVCEPPAVALYYVTKLARNHVKVLLSGEGGDEAFAGYPNYPSALRLERLERFMGPTARIAGSLAQFAGNLLKDVRLQKYGYAFGRRLGDHYFSRTASPAAFFNRSPRRLYTEDFLDRINGYSAANDVNDLLRPVIEEALLNQMLYVDTKTWLPDDLLVKADKMTMANSVELRVPLLDHHVLEFAASIEPDFKVRGLETKRLLKAALVKHLPAEVLNRRKAGLPVPYEGWLAGDLKKNVHEILFSDRTLSRGYFDRATLERHLHAPPHRALHAKTIFSLVVLELWHRAFID
jgi:asparagine synthase (glutamine-hydrolysing)